MAHDVFISYSHSDKVTADAMCATLESHGVRCWIAPRDIVPSAEWGESIIQAIENARVMVLVFSSHANASNQVVREIERAVNKGLSVIPFRIEDIAPARSLEYFLSTPHWLDALTPPLERHLDYLTETVQFLLERGEAPAGQPLPLRIAPKSPRRGNQSLLLAAGALASLVLVAVLGYGLLAGSGSDGPKVGGATPVAGTPVAFDKALAGTWRIDSALSSQGDGSTADWRVTVGEDGRYSGEIVFKDAGSLRLSTSNYLDMRPDGAPNGYSRSPDWQQNGDTAKVLTAGLIPAGALAFLTSVGGVQSGALSQFLSANEDWKRVSGGSGRALAGRWVRESTYGNFKWSMSLEITADSRYTLLAGLKDAGRFLTKNGTYREISDSGGLNDGDYQPIDANAIAFKATGGGAGGPAAQVTWRRIDPKAP